MIITKAGLCINDTMEVFAKCVLGLTKLFIMGLMFLDFSAFLEGLLDSFCKARALIGQFSDRCRLKNVFMLSARADTM